MTKTYPTPNINLNKDDKQSNMATSTGYLVSREIPVEVLDSLSTARLTKILAAAFEHDLITLIENLNDLLSMLEMNFSQHW